MHNFRRRGLPVECSIDALVAEIELPPQSAGYTLPADPAVETRVRPIAIIMRQKAKSVLVQSFLSNQKYLVPE